MPALTPAQQYARELAEGSETAIQPVANLVAAGACPGLTIVDYGMSTQHVVYCERHVGPDGKHDEEAFGMGDGDPAPWQGPRYPAGPYHYGLAYVGLDLPGWYQWPAR
jgi:hypothetical protein